MAGTAAGPQVDEPKIRAQLNSIRRPLEWIHRDEIALAILYLIEDQFGVPRSELARGIARLFGIERATSDASDHILDIADELVERGLLRDDGGRLSTVE